MASKREIRICLTHGETEFAERKEGNMTKWKCLKCEAEAVQRRRDKVKLMAIAYKGGLCLCCTYKNYTGALEFHHLDPKEKDFGISSKGYTRSWDKVKEELNKCICVCANCHREIHAGIKSVNCNLINDEVAAQEAAIIFDKKHKLK